jgi:hypothetical protein
MLGGAIACVVVSLIAGLSLASKCDAKKISAVQGTKRRAVDLEDGGAEYECRARE